METESVFSGQAWCAARNAIKGIVSQGLQGNKEACMYSTTVHKLPSQQEFVGPVWWVSGFDHSGKG